MAGVQTKPDAFRRAIAALSDIGIRTINPQALFRVTVSMPDTSLIELFASTVAYFDISSNRAIDGN